MIEFLQFVEVILFLLVVYHVIKLSPSLESAAFINGQSLKEKDAIQTKSTVIQPIKKTRVTATIYKPSHHYTGMKLAY